MILTSTSTQNPLRPEFVPATTQKASRAIGPRLDQSSTDNPAFLAGEMGSQPEVRPEVVARARALMADPNYPSIEVLRKVAEQILNSPELSEDIS